MGIAPTTALKPRLVSNQGPRLCRSPSKIFPDPGRIVTSGNPGSVGPPKVGGRLGIRTPEARWEPERVQAAVLVYPDAFRKWSGRPDLHRPGHAPEACAWLLGYAPLKVATRMGSAPMISCVRGRRVDWLHHRVFKIGGHGRTCISTDFSTSF